MKFGEVFDFRTAEEAKQYLEKKGVFSDNLRDINEVPEMENCHKLICCNSKDDFPFRGRSDGYETGTAYQFFRPILENDELMTQRQLSEWLAKGKGECSYKDTKQVSHSLPYSEGGEDKPVEDYILIRRWNATEWLNPTRAIYEEDCK